MVYAVPYLGPLVRSTPRPPAEEYPWLLIPPPPVRPHSTASCERRLSTASPPALPHRCPPVSRLRLGSQPAGRLAARPLGTRTSTPWA